MTAGIDRIVTFEVVRIIDDEPPLKPAVRLQRKPIEQRDDGGTGRRIFGQRFLVSILEFVRQRSGHLSAGAKELDLFALDEVDVALDRLEQRANLNHGEMNQKRVIGNFLDVRLGNHSSGHIFDKVDNPIPGGAALLRV